MGHRWGVLGFTRKPCLTGTQQSQVQGQGNAVSFSRGPLFLSQARIWLSKLRECISEGALV